MAQVEIGVAGFDVSGTRLDATSLPPHHHHGNRDDYCGDEGGDCTSRIQSIETYSLPHPIDILGGGDNSEQGEDNRRKEAKHREHDIADKVRECGEEESGAGARFPSGTE